MRRAGGCSDLAVRVSGRAAGLAGAVVAAAAIAACDGSRSAAPRSDSPSSAAADSAQEAETAALRMRNELPHAAFVRFQETRGEGLSRASWEVEVLQADSDIWLKGATRAAGRSIPVKESMSVEEFHELWLWLRDLDLNELRLLEDSTAAPTDWRKTLVVDFVQTGVRRVRTRNSWTRPLVGHPELVELEKRLHDRLIESSERELVRMRAQSAADSVNAAQDRAAVDSMKAGLPSSAEPGAN